MQRIMDTMVPEMEDLITQGVFSQEEVHSIIKKRRDFEYMLHRRSKVKQDFLSCILYELHLDGLRKKRKARLGK